MTLCLLQTETVKAGRNKNSGEYGDDGFPLDPDVTYKNIKANFQPMNSVDRQQLPEADRLKEVYWMWTSETEIEPDWFVERKGKTFEVQMAEDWLQQNLPHKRCMVVKLDV